MGSDSEAVSILASTEFYRGETCLLIHTTALQSINIIQLPVRRSFEEV